MTTRYWELGSRTAYEVLRLSETAQDREIVKAYRRRQREVHPDLGGDGEESARVAIAYRWLTRERVDYDRHLWDLREQGRHEPGGRAGGERWWDGQAASDGEPWAGDRSGWDGDSRWAWGGGTGSGSGTGWDGDTTRRYGSAGYGGSRWGPSTPETPGGGPSGSVRSEAAGEPSAWSQGQAGSGPASTSENEEFWRPEEVLEPEDDLWGRAQAQMDAREQWQERLLRSAEAGRSRSRIRAEGWGRRGTLVEGRQWSYLAIGAMVSALFAFWPLAIVLALVALIRMWRSPGHYRGRWLAIPALIWSVAGLSYELVIGATALIG